MLDVTYKLKAVKRNETSGIVWVQLAGDKGYDWTLANHPDTPPGFVSIAGCNNGSFRIVERTVFDALNN